MTAQALKDILIQALSPCPNFAGPCKDICRWDPATGHIPRGFGGANGPASDVRLVLITAEPADPGDIEVYSGSPGDMLRGHLTFFNEVIKSDSLRRQGRAAPFHRNLRRILDYCWPDLSVDDQLSKTWLTNAVLCSAPQSGGSFPSHVEKACVSAYMRRQLATLPNASVIALGVKASQRLTKLGIPFNASAQHPSARPNTSPERSWRRAAAEFRQWLIE